MQRTSRNVLLAAMLGLVALGAAGCFGPVGGGAGPSGTDRAKATIQNAAAAAQAFDVAKLEGYAYPPSVKVTVIASGTPSTHYDNALTYAQERVDLLKDSLANPSATVTLSGVTASATNSTAKVSDHFNAVVTSGGTTRTVTEDDTFELTADGDAWLITSLTVENQTITTTP